MLQNVGKAHADPSNTRSSTPPLSALAPTRDLKRMDASEFIPSVAWSGLREAIMMLRGGRVGRVVRRVLWGGLDDLIRDKSARYAMIEVRPETCI